MKDNRKLEQILTLVRNSDFNSIEKAEKLLENYLNQTPEDNDAWGRLAILETLTPLEDYERAVKHLFSALRYHENDHRLIILNAFFNEWYLGGMSIALIEKLNELKKFTDNETTSILLYLLAWCYKKYDVTQFETLLKESIKECAKYVNNFVDLGKHYLERGDTVLGKKLIREGLKNVIVIYKITDKINDPLDVTRFINERITGIFITEDNLLSIKKQYELE